MHPFKSLKQLLLPARPLLVLAAIAMLTVSVEIVAQEASPESLEQQLRALDLDSDLDSAVQSFMQDKTAKGNNKKAAQIVEQDDEETERRVLEFSQAMFELERDVLYPAGVSLNLFFSLQNSKTPKPSQVKVLVDGKELVRYRYKQKETRRLADGAIQPLYVGYIPPGEHQLITEVTTQRGTQRNKFKLVRKVAAVYVEIQLDSKSRIRLRSWD